MGSSRHRRRNVVDRSSATAAAEWILERRTAAGDVDVARFPDVDDPLGVVEFVERYQAVADAHLRDDAIAALGILNYLDREVDRRTLFAIRIARRTGATWSMLAGPLGLDSYQGAEQRWLRLESLFEGDDGIRDEATGRRLRRRPRRPAPAARGPVVDDAVTTELRAALGQLLALEESLPDDLADDVLSLRREATPRRAELGRGELHNALRVIANEMGGEAWPPAVQAAVDRLRAALG